MSRAIPLVSVVVPAYNHAGRLPDTLKSILTQDYPLLEVLVVDDGSTDRTAEAVKPFLAEHSNLGYVRQENRGVGQARNLGIAETKGELIAVCDADDLWLPNKLSLQAPLFDDPEVGLSYTGCVLLFPDGKEEPAGKRPVYRGHCFPELLLHNFVPCSSAVFRRSCLEKCGLFHPDKRMQGTADKHMWLKILLHYKIAGTGEPLLKLRKEYGSMSSNRDKMLLAELLCLDDIRSLCRALGREDQGLFHRAYANVYGHYGEEYFYFGDYADARRAFLNGLCYGNPGQRRLMLLAASLLPGGILRRLKGRRD